MITSRKKWFLSVDCKKVLVVTILFISGVISFGCYFGWKLECFEVHSEIKIVIEDRVNKTN